jgi:hypothetical protein
VYAWGNHRDEALLARLDIEDRLGSALPSDGPRPGYGYQRGPAEPSAGLKALPSLKTFAPWGHLDPSDFEAPPTGTKRQPDERLYDGQRILVKRGVSGTFGPYSRLVEEPLSFRHQIYCLPMHSAEPWQARVVAGILLSSLGRYRLFMTSSAWGMWYDQVYLHEVLDLPVRVRRENPATERLVAAVDQLRGLPSQPSLAPSTSLGPDPFALRRVLHDLDTAVFDLFDLADEERDLVVDFWARFTGQRTSLPLSGAVASHGIEPPDDHDDVSRYLQTFLGEWNDLLWTREARLDWEVVRDPNVPVTAAVFRVIRADGESAHESNMPRRWREALNRFAKASDLQQDSGERLYREGLLRAVSDNSIVIVKRDELRLWTRSAAREDAEATLLQATMLGKR